MLNAALTLLAGLLVGLALLRWKLPGGMMVGAVIGACAFGLATDRATMPAAAKTAAQIIAGGLIGAGISRDEVFKMRTVVKPALILMPALLAINLVSGVLMRFTGTMDMVTALMGATPGGINSMPMIAADMGADAAKVTILQLARFFVAIGLFPLAIRRMTGGGERADPAKNTANRKPIKWIPFTLTLLVATACGLVGEASPVPSGTMAFAMLGAIVLKWFYPAAHMPRFMSRLAQCLSGAYVGATIGWAELQELTRMPGPVAILVACFTVGAYLTSLLLYKVGCFDRRESLLAATPAGASDMALISADLGVHSANLIVLQVLRLVVVVSVFPAILGAFARLFP